MNEEDIALVRQIVKETLYEILETEFYDAFFSLLDAFEAGVASFKQQFASRKGVSEKPKWDPAKIKWVQVTGASGPYERYPAEGAKPEATEDYKNLLEDLKSHNGKLTRDGYFYWLFSGDQATVGRKPRKELGVKAGGK